MLEEGDVDVIVSIFVFSYFLCSAMCFFIGESPNGFNSMLSLSLSFNRTVLSLCSVSANLSYLKSKLREIAFIFVFDKDNILLKKIAFLFAMMFIRIFLLNGSGLILTSRKKSYKETFSTSASGETHLTNVYRFLSSSESISPITSL